MLSGASAQNSKSQNNKLNIKNRLWYGINLGNIGLSNNQFYINLSFMGGVKVLKNLNVGAVVHTNYTYLWFPGNEPSYNIFDYGFGGLTTFRFYRGYFAMLEIDKMYLSNFLLNGNLKKQGYNFYFVGGGYQYRSNSKWSTIITLLYNANPDTNQRYFPLNYRAAFVYNF